jgi:aquaporin Z
MSSESVQRGTSGESGEVGELAQHAEQRVVSIFEDFQDPSREWRRLFSELLGTFFLVLVAAGGGVMGQAFPNTISRTAAVVAPGLMVLGIILFMGKVSGAHLNPAVSVAFALRGDFPWRRVPGYIVVQLIGRAWRRGSATVVNTNRRRMVRITRRMGIRRWTRFGWRPS